jgi:hypothetical protein
MNTNQRVIYGEPIKALLPGLLAFKDAMTVDDDGVYRSTVTLAPTLAVPLQRALMRVEAELLREDADSIGSQDYEGRTSAQRRADGFVRLVEALRPSAPG